MVATGRGERAGAIAASLGLLIVAMAAHALAFNEPTDFWGVPWGASVEEVKAATAGQGHTECTPTGRHCFRLGRIGAASVTFGYEFAAGKLAVGTIAFASGDHPAVRAEFVERFGPPTEAQERPEPTRSGATFAIGSARWDGQSVVITLANFGSPIDRGLATLMPRDEYRRRH